MSPRIATMTLRCVHLRGDRWEAYLDWGVDPWRHQVGWTANLSQLYDAVVEEIVSRAPVLVLIDTSGSGAALYETFRERLTGLVIIKRLAAHQTDPPRKGGTRT